jgi:hypothetical protein
VRPISPKKRPGLQISRAWRGKKMEIENFLAAQPPKGNDFFGLATIFFGLAIGGNRPHSREQPCPGI